MRRGIQTGLGVAVVVAGMSPLFVLPRDEFALSTVVATSCMVAVALASGGYRKLFAPTTRTIAAGLVSAGLLYLLFFVGNQAIAALTPLGIGTSAENSIYTLIASPGNPLSLQVVVLAFDSLGFESYFRGTLQTRVGPRLGVGAPFVVAAADALVHVACLNPLWVITTFIADSVWGLTYYKTRDLTASMTSHFLWDLAIFVIFPIG